MIINNPNDPASSKQLWALYCITKKDYRKDNLTKKEASDLIQKFSKTSKTCKIDNTSNNIDTVMNDLYKFISTKYDDLYNVINRLYKKPSIIMNDTNLIPDDGKRFVMYGTCSTSYMKADKRSKLAMDFVKNFSSVNDKVEKDLLKKVGHYSQIHAVMSQDYTYNSTLYSIVSEFLANNKIPVKTYVRID